MTGYRVDLSKTAEKQIKKLDKPLQKAADALFMRIGTLTDPRSVGHALHGVLSDYWTYTIHGDWRAIAMILDETVTIEIIKIAARDKVYK